MYESYWRLRQKPFENACDPRFYFPGQSTQAAMLKLRYAIENRRGGAVLAGPAGTGKTLLVAMLRNMLAEQCAPIVHMAFPLMSTDELLAWLADELEGTAGTTAAGVHDSVRRIEHFLAANLQRQQHAVLVLDEAHLIDDGRTLEALRLLLNFERAGQPGMTLLLVGQPGILPTLDRMPQLEERLGVKCLLRPFTEGETAEYIAHRLRVAGSAQAIFEPDALVAMHRLTHGVARRINRLCDLALLIGYAEERPAITAGHLDSVQQELVTVAPE